jgi:hypothetical protein
MKFKKAINRKIYETWTYHNKPYGINLYIYCTPKGYYHFSAICSLRRCNFLECTQVGCKKRIRHSSLDDQLIYPTYAECEEAVWKWWTKHIKRGW